MVNSKVFHYTTHMNTILNTPIVFGSIALPHRLIQGPLAGFSCAPFRRLFSLFTPPAYAVSEMLSAHDVVSKHQLNGRYLYRSPHEGRLCYQISGTDPIVMADAAIKLETHHADMLDINCGCPKPKIRKKGAGSALLETPDKLIAIVRAVRQAIEIPLTVKIRLQGNARDIDLAQAIADAGADALIVHGRRWVDDYDQICNLQQIAEIKRAIRIPVVANGDICNYETLDQVMTETGCDAFMISRAGTGKPWLFEELLSGVSINMDLVKRISLFMLHLQDLAVLEGEHQAVLQSKSLVRYYFKNEVDASFFNYFYTLSGLSEIKAALLSESHARDKHIRN